MSTTVPSRRHFTAAARAAARAARQAKARLPKSDGVDVFVVRASDGKGFSWEIRRFGGLVVLNGQETFATSKEALAAGRQALVMFRAHGRAACGLEPTFRNLQEKKCRI